MKESYADDIMLCFVQGFEGGEACSKDKELEEANNNVKPLNKKQRSKRVSLHLNTNLNIPEPVDENGKKSETFAIGKTLRLSSSDRYFRNFPEVKRSLSDRFNIISDAAQKRPNKGFLTIRKTWSTGNFAASAAGGGCGGPRSAPATPLQFEPHPKKPDKHAVKSLSGSEPSVQATIGNGSEAADGKQPSKSRQKKFQRHFPQVGPEEKVLNYYSCALVGDLLLQGHLYITKNYFAFYSNVFGYVTKLLIPTTSVLRITKEKVARIIPNAVGVCTRDERHVFGSLLSRDSTYKLMMHVWKATRMPEAPKQQNILNIFVGSNTKCIDNRCIDTSCVDTKKELRVSEVELDASEYSPEDDSSSGAADRETPANPRRQSDAIIAAASAAVIQPALLTGSPAPARPSTDGWLIVLTAAAFVLAGTACLLTYSLYTTPVDEELNKLSGSELYSEIVRWRANLHTRAATELHSFLTTNLLLLTKVRQSLEALSGVILTDLDQNSKGPDALDLPNETAFS